MKTSGNTILITGGGSGIGLEIAKLFSANANKVILVGRNSQKLEKAASQIPGASFISADVTQEQDVDNLVKTVTEKYPELNVLVNNAGNAHYYKLDDAKANAFVRAAEEIGTNFLSAVRLSEKLLPILSKNAESAIVNVSSIVAFVPGISLPTYAASKAALHSYSQSLRLTLERSNAGIKVFELMPPLVNTEFSKAIGGERGMDPKDVAQALLDGFASDSYEVRPGMTNDLYHAFLNSPQAALAALNN